MKILADKNILAVEDRFARHGELALFDGRKVRREDLLGADALLVRSITTVDEILIAGTGIQFVGTATSGIDHIDTGFLASEGIGFASAKGSNANAVVDYCFAALAYAALYKGFTLSGSSIGIVGAGAVGGLFAAKLESLDVEVRCFDPLLESEKTGRDYYSLDEVLACDVLSLHVPLTRSGPHPTHHLIASDELKKFNGRVLINACRGLVVDESALKEALLERSDLVTVFDVWAGEPAIDAALAALVDISTPHIAGYSVQAKLNATEILANAFERHFDLEVAMQEDIAESGRELLSIESSSAQTGEWEAVLQAFRIDALSDQFKAEIAAGGGPKAFDLYRQKLLQRQEFAAKSLAANHFNSSQKKLLRVLGFSLV